MHIFVCWYRQLIIRFFIITHFQLQLLTAFEAPILNLKIESCILKKTDFAGVGYGTFVVDMTDVLEIKYVAEKCVLLCSSHIQVNMYIVI